MALRYSGASEEMLENPWVPLNRHRCADLVLGGKKESKNVALAQAMQLETNCTPSCRVVMNRNSFFKSAESRERRSGLRVLHHNFCAIYGCTCRYCISADMVGHVEHQLS